MQAIVTATKKQQVPPSTHLFHVKCHGVTMELTPKWEDAFKYSEELRRKHKSENVQLITIKDSRTKEQRYGKGN